MPQCIRLRRSAWYAVWHEYMLVDATWYWTRRRLVFAQGYDPERPDEKLPFEPMKGSDIVARKANFKQYAIR